DAEGDVRVGGRAGLRHDGRHHRRGRACEPESRRRAMSPESRRLAGVLLIVLPTVMIGGVSLLTLLVWEPAYAANELRQDLWRAGHAHAGVLLSSAWSCCATWTKRGSRPDSSGSRGSRRRSRRSCCPPRISSPSSRPTRRSPTPSSTWPTSARRCSRQGWWCWEWGW